MFAANFVFDLSLMILWCPMQIESVSVPSDSSTSICRLGCSIATASFLRKLMATASRMAQDPASDAFTYPACTAEELVRWAILQEWKALLEVTDLGSSWTTL